MKHTVRAFALGLIVAGVILLGAFYFVDDSDENIENITTEELIARVEEEGLRVISEEEYISYSVERAEDNDSDEKNEEENPDDEDSDDETDEEPEEENEDNNDEEDENEDEDQEVEEQEEESPSTITITIEPGMASSHISNLLEDEGLIEDAGEFNDYLLENDYSLYVRMGEHELETGMSHYEIAEALTN